MNDARFRRVTARKAAFDLRRRLCLWAERLALVGATEIRLAGEVLDRAASLDDLRRRGWIITSRRHRRSLRQFAETAAGRGRYDRLARLRAARESA